MPEVLTREVPRLAATEVPKTLVEALDPAWLSIVLARSVKGVETVEVIRTVATKVRFAVEFEDGERSAYCLKGLLDVDEATARGGPTCVLESDFYGRIAPLADCTVPECIVTVIDRERQQAVTVMRDLIVQGAVFCSALESFTPDDAVLSLGQIARLHARSDVLAQFDWIRPRLSQLAEMTYVTPETLQELLDGPRGDGLPSQVRDAPRLVAALKSLAARDVQRPQFLVHGDAHAGNVFRWNGGMGLIDWQLLQRGGWALDVAYHINAVLPPEVAEAEERRLLGEYLKMMRGHGLAMPDEDEAWLQYREAAIYGYYLWSITRRVDPPIIVEFVDRLGKAVARHGSHSLLHA
ncbi:phosphotransferase [Novosphingobium sp.]|uniref:phosphotransferase n=1 Tax=Novosphingobium sp. TaxID=1874826 RepID=UPI0028AF46D0|nr:phosphotransferase [Novosphingobium sp.]